VQFGFVDVGRMGSAISLRLLSDSNNLLVFNCTPQARGSDLISSS
jgi:6-phosphogluconate dehydrogenase (decarboxylating)